MGKSSGSSGSTPDLVGAAEAEGEAAKELAQQETYANRPTQYNPWGSTTWGTEEVWDPTTNQYVTQWTQTENLNDQLQSALDSQFGTTSSLSGLANQLASDYASSYQPLDFSQFGDVVQMGDYGDIGEFTYDTTAQRQAAEDAAYASATSRLDPQFEQQAQALETKLRNQGLRPGDQAWQSAMDTFNRSKTDAYQQARYAATEQGLAESQNMYNQALGGYTANLGAQQQDYSQQLEQTNLANQLRSQQIQEALTQQGLPLEQINQIMSQYGVSGSTPSSTEEVT